MEPEPVNYNKVGLGQRIDKGASSNPESNTESKKKQHYFHKSDSLLKPTTIFPSQHQQKTRLAERKSHKIIMNKKLKDSKITILLVRGWVERG